MSLNRAALCLPVLAGLVLTGSAVARIAPATGDEATPACERNGVHPNPQGHPSCGLHLGWSTEATTGTETDATAGECGTEPAATKMCKNREVRLNKNGHPTCGLHKGWDKHQTPPTATSGAGPDTAGSQPTKDTSQKAAHAHGASHSGKHGGKAAKHSR
jgi:hypothetical protein